MEGCRTTDMGLQNDQLQVECIFWAPMLGGGGLRYRGGFVVASISDVQALGGHTMCATDVLFVA